MHTVVSQNVKSCTEKGRILNPEHPGSIKVLEPSMRMIALKSDDLSDLHKFLKLCAANTFALMFSHIPNPSTVFILVTFYSPNHIICTLFPPQPQIQKSSFSSAKHLFMVFNTLSNEKTG